MQTNEPTEPLPPELERVAGQIAEAAARVHAAMGPGQAKAVYQACMAHEFVQRRIPFEANAPLPVRQPGAALAGGLRLDLLVDQRVIVELAALAELPPVFEQQLRGYLALADLQLALLINFNAPQIADGIVRVVR